MTNRFIVDKTTLNSLANPQFATLIPAEAISSGDPVAMLSDGAVVSANPPNDPDYGLKPMVLTADAVNTFYKNTIVTTGTAFIGAVLKNGNVAIPSIAASTSYPTVAIYAPSGALVASVTLEAAAAIQQIRLDALSGGGLAVAYKTAAGLRYAVLDNVGAVVSAPATLTANATSALGVLGLSGGGFALLWYYNTGAGFQFSTAAFNAGGVQQGATNQIETVASTESVMTGKYGAAMCRYGAAGGYCVAYDTTSGNSSSYNARIGFFSASAVLQNSMITVNNSSNAAWYKLATLTDGSVVFANAISTAGANRYVKYNALGVQTVAATQFDGGAVSSFALLPLPGATFGIFYNVSGSDLIQKLYDSAGAIVNPSTVTYASAFGGGGSFAAMDIKALSDGSFLAAVQNSSSPTPRAARLNPSLTSAIATAISIDSATASGTSSTLAIYPTTNPATSEAFAIVQYTTNITDYRIGNFVSRIKARSFIGVAANSSAAGVGVDIQLTGGARISKSFSPGLSIDYRSNSIIGQKAFLLGNLAVLQGVQL